MKHFGIVITLILLLTGACSFHKTAEPTRVALPETIEYQVRTIPLAGELSTRQAEVSGMAWLDDNLILLPQYPGRFDNSIFVLKKSQILDFLDGSTTTPLTARKIAFNCPGLSDSIRGFEGFEAIAFRGRQAFLTIESRPGINMQGFIITGNMDDDLNTLNLDQATLTEIPDQSGLGNMTDEALLLIPGGVLTFHEANGRNVNPAPQAHHFGFRLEPQGAIPFPSIEYRITDATTLDKKDCFWAINYFYPGEKKKLAPATDRFARLYGEGPTHADCETVERLVELSYSPRGIEITHRPPLQLELIDDDHARNWEGIVRLDNRGFLLISDKHPATILGFVPFERN